MAEANNNGEVEVVGDAGSFHSGDEANEVADQPKKVDDGTEIKKPRKPVFNYKPDNFLNDPTGVNWLFKKMTIEPELVDGIRGKGHEVNDLKKIMDTYKEWH